MQSRRAVIEPLEDRRLLSAVPLSLRMARMQFDMLGAARIVKARSIPSVKVASGSAMSAPLVTAASAAAQDTVIFGNAASETSHGFTHTNSQTIAGALGQPARQLLPLSPAQVNGGEMSVTMAVDPVNRNYFTLKLWGSDDTDASKGRLYLYVPIDGVNYQVGYRHEGDYMPLSVASDKRPLPGRFFYSTTLLPLSMTQGKTSLTLKIISTGELYGLGSGGPPSGNYQFSMSMNSRGIYRAYTHTQPLLDVTGETQGAAPATTTRNTHTENGVLGPTGTYTTGLNNWVTGRLGAAVTAFTASDVEMLARSYSVAQLSTAFNNAALVTKVIAVLDGFATDYYANPSNAFSTNNYGANGGNEIWGGRFGALGWAIHLLSAQLQISLDTTTNYGAGGDKTRRQAWGEMLLASRDYGRFNRDGRYLTNQSLVADSNIYKANRGMLALGNVNSFTESAAQRFLKESIGLEPWRGSDTATGGSTFKYGGNYYQVTSDGLTREWGYAGGYSEMQVYAAWFYKATGNIAFRDQAIKMVKAIAKLRRPSVDISGANNYRSMERIGLIAWRGVRESDGNFSNEIAYGDQGPWSGGMSVAGATLDPSAVGYAKQMLADGQYFSQLVADNRYYSALTFDSRFAFEAYDDYFAVRSAPDSGIRVPMTSGQPDFAWADEENGIVVVKRGNERLWLSAYWQAKAGTGVNGIGRFHYSSAQYDQYGVVETNPQYTASGAYFVRPNLVDYPERTLYQPPDNPTQAYLGEQLPIAAAPTDARDSDPFRGRADFYALRFGNYLIGINDSDTASHELKTPSGFTSATDLVSGMTKSGTVTVAPNGSVVLYLSSNSDAAPVPTAPLLLTASGSPTQVSLNWTAASGANSYNIKRAMTVGGPYTTITTGLTNLTYADTNVTRAAAYYYVVSASNANGESYNSSQAVATAGLPAPWSNQDIGAVTLPGNANLQSSTYSLRGSGSGIGGTADALHFAYMPLTGDVTIVARVASFMDTNGGDRAGVMIRETLDPGAKRAMMQLEPSGNPRLNSRATTNGTSATSGSLGGIYAPYWVKLERAGNTFRGYVSPDGVTWTASGTSTITMGAPVYVGLAVTSSYAQQLNATTFDNVQITAPSNAAPTVATAAGATPNPVTAASTNLSVLGADDGGEANLTYDWSVTSKPAGAADPIFSDDNTNAAKSTTATFSKAGAYQFLVTIRDWFGRTTTSTRSVTVQQTATTVSVTPSGSTVAGGTTKQFAASAVDQFGSSMSTTFTWSATGGSVSPSGVFTAGQSGGQFAVTATSGSAQGSATVDVVPTVYNGTGGPDEFAVRRSGAALAIWLGDGTGTPTYTIEAALVPSLTFNGNDGDDALTVLGSAAADTVTFDDSSIDLAGTNVTRTSVEATSFNGNGGGDDVTINSTTVHMSAAQALNSLSINGAGVVVTVTPSTGLLRTGSLTIASGGRLELGRNDLLVDADGAIVESQIRQYVRDATVSGSTTGIFGDPAAPDMVLAIAHAAELGQSSFHGIDISPDAVVGKFTFYGDANLDGRVTSDDYVAVDVGLGQGDSWVEGDFNFSGSITSDDYVAIDVNLGKGTSG